MRGGHKDRQLQKDEETEKEASRNYLRKVGDTEDETNRVEDVRFARAVQASDGVEVGVEIRYNDLLGIRLESINHNFLDVHRGHPEEEQNNKGGGDEGGGYNALLSPPTATHGVLSVIYHRQI